MGNKVISAAAPADGVNVSSTSGGGQVIAGTSIPAIVHPKVPQQSNGEHVTKKGE
jgi:hypothetical protein